MMVEGPSQMNKQKQIWTEKTGKLELFEDNTSQKQLRWWQKQAGPCLFRIPPSFMHLLSIWLPEFKNAKASTEPHWLCPLTQAEMKPGVGPHL